MTDDPGVKADVPEPGLPPADFPSSRDYFEQGMRSQALNCACEAFAKGTISNGAFVPPDVDTVIAKATHFYNFLKGTN